MGLIKIPGDWDSKRRAMFGNAKRLFAKFGVAHVTIDDIARGYTDSESPADSSCGSVPQATVLALYSRKEELLKVVMDLIWEGILAEMRLVSSDEQVPARQRLCRLVEVIPAKLGEDLDAAGVMVRERYPHDAKYYSAAGCPQAIECLGMLVHVIREAAREKQMRMEPEQPSAIAICVFGAAMHGMLNVYIRAREQQRTESPVESQVEAHRRVELLSRTLKAMAVGALVLPPLTVARVHGWPEVLHSSSAAARQPDPSSVCGRTS